MNKEEDKITRLINGKLFSFSPSVWDMIYKNVDRNVNSWLSSQSSRFTFEEKMKLESYAISLLGNIRNIK